MVVAMNRFEQIQTVGGVLEIAGPLLLGVVTGVLHQKFVFPRVLARMGSFARVVTSPANVLLSIVLVGVWLGLAVVCHSSNASETLAWLQAHLSSPPLPLTPDLLRNAFFAATFFSGAGLATLPSASSSEEGPANM
jgi:hypothetical protein